MWFEFGFFYLDYQNGPMELRNLSCISLRNGFDEKLVLSPDDQFCKFSLVKALNSDFFSGYSETIWEFSFEWFLY